MRVAAVTVAAAAELTVVAAITMAVRMAATLAGIVVVAATVTATAFVSEDNRGDSDCGGNRQQSTKSGSKDMGAVGIATESAKAMETALVTATTKTPMPTILH
jgi:hypothetical protein